jgi:hypothetical protein
MIRVRCVCFILIIFTLSACENNAYQVYELKEAAEEISRGELSPDFGYPKNTLYIDSLKIRLTPCKEKGRCSEELVDELHMATVTYFDSTVTHTKAIFSAISPGNAALEDNYMSLYSSVKELVANNGMVLKLSDRNTEAMEKAYADWQRRQ